MKWVFFFLPLVLFCAPPIVFVQLGPRLPDYMSTALEQARLFNPDSPIYLIGNRNAFRTLPRAFVSSGKVNLVAVETLGKQRIHQQFIARSRLDRTYREGFWTYTTQRFFYLADFMHQNGLSDVFHLESDVMLYANIGELLPHCQAHYANMIAVPSDCDARCIASFIYVANVTPLDAFLQFVTDKVRDIDNDMHFLAHFRHRYFQVYIDHFPVIFPDYAKDHALISRFGDVTATPERYMSYFDDFQAVFDAAAIGQYLGGIDPRNGESVPGFVNESTLFNVADFQYEWIADEKGRKVPHMIYQGQKIKINNLHIHSKRLDAFKS